MMVSRRRLLYTLSEVVIDWSGISYWLMSARLRDLVGHPLEVAARSKLFSWSEQLLGGVSC